jgi:pimeloyl-ACP methyl ester carboxylesterase/ribosomal protein S18 acetylase RimI-like enzyme
MDPGRGGRGPASTVSDLDPGRTAADAADAARLTIRRAGPDDGLGIGDVWLASWRATFDFPPSHPDADVRRWLAEELVPRHETWVAVDPGGRVVAVMALSDTMIEQLYVAPDWIGRGLGRRLVDLARERRPAGLELFCFQANQRARAFYEHLGFIAVAEGDGSGNEERQPDIRYAWRPGVSLAVRSADGTAIAVFRSGTPDGPPLVLVHGAAADHTTFRVVGPLLGTTFDVYAIDRRGRGASGDTVPYAIEREFEDVAAVATTVAAARGLAAIDVFGHSYGGRCALGAALATSAIARVISYEGAPSPPGERYGDPALAGDLGHLAATDQNEALLVTFLERVVGMTPEELARYRADPIWPRRVAAAGTIARELLVEASDTASLEALALVRQPVLQLLGSESSPVFTTSTSALNERLADGRVVVIAGARHAAHHTHPDAVVAAVRAFLAGPV